MREVAMRHELHHSGDSHSRWGLGTRRAFLSSMVSAAVFSRWAIGRQNPAPQDAAADMTERFRQMSEDYEREGLAQPFKGITTDGNVAPGLFQIAPSGVSTEPVRNAAQAFIATL